MLASGAEATYTWRLATMSNQLAPRTLGVLTGRILRLNVEMGQPNAIPPSNPFVDSDAHGEGLGL